MTASRENYASVVRRLFGDIVTFDPLNGPSNNVIGALDRATFDSFTRAFEARLERMARVVATRPHFAKAVCLAVNQIADSHNWEGAFAELSALDFLLETSVATAENIELDVKLDASATFAGELGGKQADLDIFLNQYSTYIDVKTLSDKTKAILDSVRDEVFKRKSIASMAVLYSYDQHMPFETFQALRRELVVELDILMDVNARPKRASSTVIPGLTYQFSWKPGVMMAANEYDPAEHGKNHHELLFKHAKKFHKTQPCGIAFVHFPWYGEKLFPISDMNVSFFTAFAQHFFCSYEGKIIPASSLNKSFKSGITAHAVAMHLSFVLFLEDKSVTSTNVHTPNVTAHYMLNPHAVNDLRGTPFHAQLDRCATSLA